ncbi:carbonyl reductase (NADPH-dependent) [Sugiyamaella lignohabitans]|uniref:Carbonyl reductase (NADPH-dependent) n=1 Tax=Sugiyamaella lignohabitans TaxID=796027 RepID=A0A167E3M5_9ASCO|nr:carbonyl reductase (NADPH-dependent) [Sugiyamaella lignohabitans]ANB13596.1 carbonyl reductase (NADPH-dependent) [Sugiyamaella lignohabitans]
MVSQAILGSKGTVLVSGASGFIAAHVIQQFVESGYKVVGTVRNQTSIDNFKKTSTYQQYSDYIRLEIVADISAAGAFDEAVKGVDGVIHTQSPFVLNVQDNEKDLLIPAIQGTVGILKSIKENNPFVKRVVVTSSFAAIVDLSKGVHRDHVYSEKDWNPVTYEEGKATDIGAVAYCASKVLAEKAAHEFVAKEKPNFTVATINPPMVYGPNLHYISDLSRLGESPALIYSLINGSLVESGVPETGFPAWVDVRDVALAHLRAYENPKSAGQRYFVTAGSFLYDEMCQTILDNFPQFKGKVPVPTGANTLDGLYRTDNTKARTELGINFRSLEECTIDSVNSFLPLLK